MINKPVPTLQSLDLPYDCGITTVPLSTLSGIWVKAEID